MLDSKKDTIRKLDPHFLSHEDDTNQVMVENDFQNEVDNRVLEEQYLKNEEGKKLMTGYKKVEILERSSHGKDSPFTDDRIIKSFQNEARNATQILAVIAVSFGAYIYGTTVVFPAVANPSLRKSNKTYWSSNATSYSSIHSNVSLTSSLPDDTLSYNSTIIPSMYAASNQPNSTDAYLPFLITDFDLSLVASLSSLGMLVGTLAAGPSSNTIGRKWTYILGVCGSLGVGYALIAAAQNRWMLHLGRFLHGIGLGVSTTVATVYTMEIATPNMRGRLAVIPAIAGTLGILTAQCIGAVCNWQWISIICGGFNIPLLIALLFIPESPVYLISKDQIDRAHRVLRVLRGPNWNVTAELTDIKVAAEKSKATKRTWKPRDFLEKTVWKPFLIAVIMMYFFQFTAINIVLMFTPDIFSLADPSPDPTLKFIDEFLGTILVGIALLISNIITLVFADIMRRRLMLIFSAFGISVSLFGIGAFLHLISLEKIACCSSVYNMTLQNCTDPFSVNEVSLFSNADDCPKIHTENIQWLPLLLLMLYIFFFNLGYGALIWMTVVEILPQHVRTVATSFAVSQTCISGFLVSHTYIGLKSLITPKWVFWFYGILSVIGLLFIFIFVPETKGKTEAQIQQHFNKVSNPKRKSK